MDFPTYRLRQGERLRAVALDDELVVFNPTTWETHILNAAAAVVLDALAERPRTAQQVADLLQDSICVEEASHTGRWATDLLSQLESLSLIEPL
jgi:PqqD family protein of HPr-rel-A system